ncbi:MAG TPA: EscU/YscU/HrcU family type III secretion system export apparatus switch protein [Polyangiaceae bacterium]
MSDKTEQPTPRRLRRAREQGDGPVSAAFVSSVAFLLPLVLVPAVAEATAARATELVHAAARRPDAFASARALALDVTVLSVPVLLAAALGAVAAGLVQTRGYVSASRLALRFDRLDPAEGIKSLFRLERALAVVRALVLAGVVALFSWVVFRGHAADLAFSAGNERAVIPVVLALGRKIAWAAALVALAFGALDIAVTLRAWRERHKMSKDEVRREYREAEGDPQVKAQRRRAHQEALTGSILNAVKDATVVIVNPTHLANALRYREQEDEAPRLVAQGRGELARRIVEAARAYGVPCVVDVPVARALAELETGDEIPEVLYEAVAEILRELAEPSREGAADAPLGRARDD